MTWTTRTAAAANAWAAVVWAPGLSLFVAVAQSGASRVMTSPDGITWTARTAAAALLWQAIAWSPSLGLLVAVANTGATSIMTSPDGIAWTSRTGGPGWGIAWSPALGLFVITNTSVATSPDGITWTTRTAPSANLWYGVTWAAEPGLFVAVAFNGGVDAVHRIMTSPDGIAWIAWPEPAVGTWTGVAYAPSLGRFVAVSGSGGTIQVMSSTVPIYKTLAGIPSSGPGSILYPIHQGDPVNLRVEINDLDAQSVIAALMGGGAEDGVIEGPVLQDGRISETEARSRGVAMLALRSGLDVAVAYQARDLNTHAGRTIAIALPSPHPFDLAGSFKIQSVTLSGFAPALFPRRTVQAASRLWTLEALLRQIRLGAA